MNRDRAAFARIESERVVCEVSVLQRVLDCANADLRAVTAQRDELLAQLRGADAAARDLGCTCEMYPPPFAEDDVCLPCQVRSFTDVSRWQS